MFKSWYTLGRVISTPTKRQSKDGKAYSTVYVELFGGMRVSALTGAELSKDMYVGVKITPKKDGQAAYSVILLDEKAKDMILGAASYIDAPARARVDDDDELLPF